MKKRFDLVIFDLDGTLIDNRVAIRKNFNYARELYGYPPLAEDQIYSMIGTPLLEMFEKTLPESDKHLTPQLVNEYRKRYRSTCHKGVIILDSAIPTLEYLKKEKFKLAVATTKANNEVHILLKKIGLYEYFDVISGFKEGMKNKPSPDIVQYIMHTLCIESPKTALVGDTPMDVMTARNAGIYAIAVTSSISLGMTTMDKINNAKPDVVISSLHELPNHLYIS